MMSQTVFPPDIRLEKEIMTLSKAGFTVLVVCNQFSKDLNPSFSNCEINRINAVFKSAKLNKFINFPIFFNPRYLIKTFQSVIKFKPDFIHAHDLPMMPLAIFFGKLFRLPVIFDMHENYPEALKQFKKRGITNFIFKNYRLAKILEKFCIKFSDRIIVVIEENKERLIKMGVAPSSILVISNTVDLNSFIKSSHSDIRITLNEENVPFVIYTGTVSPDRGLLTAVKSTIYFNELNIKARLFIVGNGSYKKYLVDFVIKNSLNSFVKFIQWPGHDLVPNYINEADIGIIPQPKNEFIDTTIPHKLFEYMYMKKPILVSDAAPFKRIIEETNAGVIFKSNDPLDFAKKLKYMLSVNKSWGQNGYKAVLSKYNWAIDSKELLRVYDSFNFASKVK